MDDAEAHAEKYLNQLGLGPVRYEPDGNRPPDFVLVDGTAVEVRRLNQHAEIDGGLIPLEHDAFPTLNGMRALLETIRVPTSRSWWVSYTIDRPALQWKALKPLVRSALLQVASANIVSPQPIRVHSCLTLRFIAAEGNHDRPFILGGYTDRQAGGWVLYELQRNIQFCSDEKATKVAPFRSRYRHWWLVLIDHIGRGRGALEIELFEEHVRVQHSWDRLILLDPSDFRRAQDVKSSVRAA